jgi:predicted heme/steroid binding protein
MSMRHRNPRSKPLTRADHDRSAEDVSRVSDGEEQGISLLDIVRVLTTLLALWLSLSYYLTSGESLTFNHRPWFTRLDRLTAYLVCASIIRWTTVLPFRHDFFSSAELIDELSPHPQNDKANRPNPLSQRGPLTLTPSQLALYNGTSHPDLPIFLAINGTVFDVSASSHTYGPGGSYHIFAGRDATRAYVTGCFSDDLRADLAGVERMFIPIEDEDEKDVKDDGEERRYDLASGQKKIRAERERREAKTKVQMEVDKWVEFYRRSEKYFEVGRVIEDERREKGSTLLCDAAERKRPRRSQLKAREEEGVQRQVFTPIRDGKPV